MIPQLREAWALSPNSAAWLTITVQLGFVAAAVIGIWAMWRLKDAPDVVKIGGGKG